MTDTNGTNGTQHQASGPTDLELYDARRLMGLVVNSSRRWALTKAAELVARGVLKKDGKKWIGSRSAVIAALVGAS